MFLSCAAFPSGHDTDSGTCRFWIFPQKVSGVPQDRNACPFGEGKSDFTLAKQHALAASANVAALLCLCLAIITVVMMWFRGQGTLRSARGSFTSSFLCGLTGCAAIVLYYVAINPCKKDICSAMDDAARTDAMVSCWALSPVGHIIAMLMVFAGGCCSQRWAPNPDAEEERPAPNPNPNRAEEMPAMGVPVAPMPANFAHPSTGQVYLTEPTPGVVVQQQTAPVQALTQAPSGPPSQHGYQL